MRPSADLPLPLLLAGFLLEAPGSGTPEYDGWIRALKGAFKHTGELWGGPPVESVGVGDWVCVRQRNGKMHHGVVVDEDRVVHGTTKYGVIETSLAVFRNVARDGHLRLVRRPSNMWNQAFAVEIARSQVGKPYSFFGFNCEHVASMAHLGHAESQQLRVAASLLTTLATGFAKYKWEMYKIRARHGPATGRW